MRPPRHLIPDPSTEKRRSKAGCLTCRTRRKKCPEDFQVWSDGTTACSTCHARGEICRKTAVGSNRRVGNTSKPMGESHSLRQDASTSCVSSSPPSAAEWSSSLSPGDASSIQTAMTDLNGGDPAVGPYTILPVGQDHESFWIDNFFEDILRIANQQQEQPQQQQQASASGPQNSTSTPALSMGPPSSQGMWSQAVIDRTVHSQQLDNLLEKCSPMYERYMGAIIEDSQPVLHALMRITQSSNECKAAMVACCLAYLDVIAKESKSAVAPSGLVRFLTRGGKAQLMTGQVAQPTAKDAHAWLSYAQQSYHAGKHAMTQPARLLTVLNLRFACMCLRGAAATNALAGEVHVLLSAMQISPSWIQENYTHGSIVDFLTQSLVAANIMDVAIARNARAALSETAENTAHTPRVGPNLPEEENTQLLWHLVTGISAELWQCMRSIAELSADIAEGVVTLKVDVEVRAEALQKKIMSAAEAPIPARCEDSLSRIRAYCLHELWRQTILLYYYQDVHRLGPMASRVKSTLSQMLQIDSLLKTTEEDQQSHGPTGRADVDVWDTSMVWFLACTVAVTDDQRQRCRANLEMIGRERVVLDNLDAVTLIWRNYDETGHWTDWKEVLVQHGLSVCYTF